MPVGFKNGTSGDCQIAVDAIKAATAGHIFLSVSKQGLAAIVESKGNSDCHLILRGGSDGPNYSAEHCEAACQQLRKGGQPEQLIVDCSHGNSQKIHTNQPIVAAELARRISAGDQQVAGVMLESFLLSGRQDIVDDVGWQLLPPRAACPSRLPEIINSAPDPASRRVPAYGRCRRCSTACRSQMPAWTGHRPRMCSRRWPGPYEPAAPCRPSRMQRAWGRLSTGRCRLPLPRAAAAAAALSVRSTRDAAALAAAAGPKASALPLRHMAGIAAGAAGPACHAGPATACVHACVICSCHETMLCRPVTRSPLAQPITSTSPSTSFGLDGSVSSSSVSRSKAC
eukprot:COSAG01_NODE_832_length_13250_cov_23.422828_12_plen_341_part_00